MLKPFAAVDNIYTGDTETPSDHSSTYLVRMILKSLLCIKKKRFSKQYDKSLSYNYIFIFSHLLIFVTLKGFVLVIATISSAVGVILARGRGDNLEKYFFT